jgi:hypothetical protein
MVELSEEFQTELKENCEEGSQGSIIINWIKQADNDFQISFTAFMGRTTLRPLVNVQTRSFYLTMLGLEEAIIGE